MTQIAPEMSSDTLCPNPACGAANRAGTRFCASCGTSLGGTSSGGAPTPQLVPVMPPQPPRFQAQAGMVPVATDKSADVQLAPEWAYNHLTQALQGMNAEIVTQSPPAGLSAVLSRKAIGNPIRFRCQAVIQATGPASSRIAYGIKVDWHSTILMLGLLTGIGAFNLMFLTMSVGLWAPLLSAVALGWAVYDYSIAVPNKLAGELHKRLMAGPQVAPAPAPVAPSNITPMPHVAPPPVAASPVAPAPAADDDIIVRLEKLAVLKDKGLISATEFDNRRAELLDRL